MSTFTERNHPVCGIAPDADVFSGTVATDVWKMTDHKHALIEVIHGTGTSGTTVMTVEACDDFTPGNTTAIPFKYRTGTLTGALGALTDATSAGITLGAGGAKRWYVEVDADEVAATGYPNLRAKFVEGVDAPIDGCVQVWLSEGRYQEDVNATAIA